MSEQTDAEKFQRAGLGKAEIQSIIDSLQKVVKARKRQIQGIESREALGQLLNHLAPVVKDKIDIEDELQSLKKISDDLYKTKVEAIEDITRIEAQIEKLKEVIK
jgi:glutamine synthetase adenylyltransferase